MLQDSAAGPKDGVIGPGQQMGHAAQLMDIVVNLLGLQGDFIEPITTSSLYLARIFPTAAMV